MQITASANNGVKKNVLIYFIFLILSILLFWPVLHKSFVSDDFAVLHRIVFQKKFFIQGFFRPLSDISLYLSYIMFGFNAFYYNIVNVAIHAGCTFLLYRFCLSGVFSSTGNLNSFACVASFLFLIYPFHNEAVIWAIGRGIILSGFFGFLSLLVLFTDIGNLKKYSLSCLFYFISMYGYETVLPMPAIALILLYIKDKSLKKLLPPAGFYLVTILVNIIIRIQVSGYILGAYSSKMFSLSLSGNCVKFLKATARLFLPPSSFSLLLSICFGLLLVFFVFAGIWVVKKRKPQACTFIAIIFITLIANIIPVFFGISTKSYEGDRVFYFSSFFLCVWIAYLVSLVQNMKIVWGARLMVAGYFLFYFYQNILTWRKSGQMAENIISMTGDIKHSDGKVYLLNIPEEYYGTQVLRNGFKEALLINNIDTAGIVAINYISTELSEKLNGNVKPENLQQGNIFIYPGAVISCNSLIARVRMDKSADDSVHITFNKTDKIYYWNKESIVLLQNPCVELINR